MSFFERMRKVMNQGLSSTRDALEVAADKAKEMGEKGVLKYEIGRLEREAERKFSLLGSDVYRILISKGQSTVSKSTAEIKEVLEEILDLEKRIQDKEELLKEVGKSPPQ